MSDEDKVKKKFKCSCGETLKIELPREKMQAGVEGSCPYCDQPLYIQSDVEDTPSASSESTQSEWPEQLNQRKRTTKGNDGGSSEFQLGDAPDSSDDPSGESASSPDAPSEDLLARKRRENTFDRSDSRRWFSKGLLVKGLVILIAMFTGAYLFADLGLLGGSSGTTLSSVPSVLPADTDVYLRFNGLNSLSEELDRADVLKKQSTVKEQLQSLKREQLPKTISNQLQVPEELSAGMVKSLKEAHLAVTDIQTKPGDDRGRRSGRKRGTPGVGTVFESTDLVWFLRLDTKKFLEFIKQARMKKGENGEDPLFQQNGEYRGVPRFSLEGPGETVQIARLGEWVMFAKDAEQIQALVDAAKDGSEQSLSNHDSFRTARNELAGGNGFWCYLGSSLFSDVYERAKKEAPTDAWKDQLEENREMVQKVTLAGFGIGEKTKGMVQFEDRIPSAIRLPSLRQEVVSRAPKHTLGVLASGFPEGTPEKMRDAIEQSKQKNGRVKQQKRLVEHLGNQFLLFLSRKTEKSGNTKKSMPVHAGGVIPFEDSQRAYELISDIADQTAFLTIEEARKNGRRYYKVSKKKRAKRGTKKPGDQRRRRQGKQSRGGGRGYLGRLPETLYVGRKDDLLILCTGKPLLLSMMGTEHQSIQENDAFQELSLSSEASAYGALDLSGITSMVNQKGSGLVDEGTWLSVSLKHKEKRGVLSSSVSWGDFLGLVFSGARQFRKTRKKFQQRQKRQPGRGENNALSGGKEKVKRVATPEKRREKAADEPEKTPDDSGQKAGNPERDSAEDDVKRGTIRRGNAVWKGKIKNGKPHGKGTYTFSNGTKYVGTIKNGEMTDDQAKYIWESGKKYIGEVNDGKVTGRGMLQFTSGREYLGRVENAKRDGWGIQYGSEGAVNVQGYWENDDFQGIPKGEKTSIPPFDAMNVNVTRGALTSDVVIQFRAEGQILGTLRSSGWSSSLRDHWESVTFSEPVAIRVMNHTGQDLQIKNLELTIQFDGNRRITVSFPSLMSVSGEGTITTKGHSGSMKQLYPAFNGKTYRDANLRNEAGSN